MQRKIMLDLTFSKSMERWYQTKLPPNATVQQAINNLDETAMQIILVVSSDNHLLGTVTDGDIRRGFLRGLDMHSVITEIMHHYPLVVPEELTRDNVIHLMHVNRINQIPIVDIERHVIGLHLLNE